VRTSDTEHSIVGARERHRKSDSRLSDASGLCIFKVRC